MTTMKSRLWRFSGTALTTFSLVFLTGASAVESKNQDLELRIGIVQRFGENPQVKLQLEPTPGDRLQLRFTAGNQEKTLVTQNPVKLETVMESLPKLEVEEVVVLGTYRTFETAEDSAKS